MVKKEEILLCNIHINCGKTEKIKANLFKCILTCCFCNRS